MENNQKAWLSAAKRTLSKSNAGLTWDDFAALAGIEPRAFKTYRMPEASKDYRKMPPLVEAAIKALLEKASTPSVTRLPPSDTSALLVPALAALVVRLARTSLIDGRMIAGVSRFPGMPVGLSAEDRAAMALVSRACLVNGLPDKGAEIHELLFACTRPFEEWLDVPEVANAGLGKTNLIYAEDGIPTAEAEDLARKFSGVTAGLEEQLFIRFLEVLGKQPTAMANEYYTLVREFVVRHPLSTNADLKKFSDKIHVQLWLLMRQDFYEPVPESWEINGAVPLCAHCGNAMKLGRAGNVCRTAACAASRPALEGGGVRSADILRATRGIRQYWIEPGLDEVRLFDALCSAGHAAELYPQRDRVDIAVGDIGIDLKAYSSPEILGQKLKQGLGGLSFYGKKLLVIPDWVQKSTPSYLDRLRMAMERPEVVCMTVSETEAWFRRGGHHA